ncbi:putative conserved secretory protein [Mycobacterium ulcerans str. Harvey]|uniref:Conserved secretory protein n=1 Tax=Mycobacterium ulcerans str. Harvey TaxID=1299332 RepID=A0ABN0R4W6_MYCUL|nr:putative conserved secretory protein [Mycobacterium ulcerans str. Harvey]
MVGVAKPIIINFQVPIADQAMAKAPSTFRRFRRCGQVLLDDSDAGALAAVPILAGNTAVNIDAAGTKSSFRTGDSLVAPPTTPRTR